MNPKGSIEQEGSGYENEPPCISPTSESHLSRQS